MSIGREEARASDAWIADLYRRHARWLTRRLRRRFGDDADDYAQEAWRRLLVSYGGSPLVRHPRALLLRIATNAGLDGVKQASRRKRIPETASTPESGTVEAPQEAALALEEIVLALPEQLRDVFLLSRFGGLTNRQIAEQLGISPKTVEWRMTRALAHCAAQLRR